MEDRTESALPSERKFDDLLKDSRFEQIQSYLHRFNPIRVMKMEDMEIRHSSILGWLMTPSETHGLGDRFLKSFLASALSGQSDGSMAMEIKGADLSGALVDIEKQSIDIFILCKKQNWAFVVENKYGSKQHSDQLTRYKDSIHSQFGDSFTICGIFLTLDHEEPKDEGYVLARYDTICNILDEFVSSEGWKGFDVKQDARLFIEHYLDVLKRKMGMDDELKILSPHSPSKSLISLS